MSNATSTLGSFSGVQIMTLQLLVLNGALLGSSTGMRSMLYREIPASTFCTCLS